MKKFYSFLLMATALLISGNMQAIKVSDLAGLKAALLSGGEITLTADINAGSEQLDVTQVTTINGNGHYIKSTSKYVLQVKTSDKVVMNDLVIYAAKTSKQGRGILIDDNTNNAKLDLNNVTINCTYRAMDVWYSDNVTLNINDCVFQNVQGQTVEANGNPTSANYDIELESGKAGDTRGLNFGQLTNSTITINNTVMQGFFYVLNNVTGDNGDMTGSKLVASNSTFKGRAALNVWGFNGTYEFNDCTVIGINNYGGGQEGFSCFVMNNQATCHDNTLTINGGTVVSAVFDAVGGSNPNANQYMIDDRATNNTFVINNSQYTCTKELGNDKGGIFYRTNPTTVATINGGIYDCPNIVAYTISNSESIGSLVINGGTFDVDVIALGIADDGDVYKTIEINGGNFKVDDTEHGIDAELDGNTLLGENMQNIDNIDGSETVVPKAEAAKVEKVTEDQNVTEDAEKYMVGVAANKTITVKEGKTLTIDKGGLLFEDNTAKIVVEDGGTLVLKGNVNGNGDENSIVIETSEGSNTSFLIAPDVNVYLDEHPQGTFKFISKAYKEGSKWIDQRFGLPVYDGNTTITWAEGKKAYLYDYDYTLNGGAGDWRKLNAATASTGSYVVTNKAPFACFDMLVDTEAAGTEFTFTGSLMGNQDAQLNLVKDWNFLANSYTAPIDIYEFMQDILAKSGNYVSATAYIYRAEDNWWDMVNLGDFELNAELGDEVYPVAQKKIKPMQAFVLKLVSGTTGKAEISYENNVYNPALGIANAGAPRRAAADNIDAAIRMSINNGEYTDNMTLIEGYNFSEAFDNGFDAQKFMNNGTHNLYAMTMDGNMGAVATNNLEGTVMSFKAAKAGNYTISFDAVMNANYALKDMKTNAVINIEKGATYSFNAEAGEEEGRFAIIGRADAPTGVNEVVNVVKGQEGIYTITGVYVGEKAMLNTLPAGVYVVDGKKIVK
jgi:hypothetical protein